MNKRNIIISICLFIAATATVFFLYPKNDLGMDVRTPCVYETFSDTLVVAEIKLEEGREDSFAYVDFVSTTGNGVKHSFGKGDLSQQMKKNNFTTIDILDSTSRFVLTAERITSGTCSPISGEELKLVRKK